MIHRLVVFAPLVEAGWCFRCSVSDGKNIMLIAIKGGDKPDLKIKFFDKAGDVAIWKAALVA